MQNNSSARRLRYLSFIAGFALIITALGSAFFPNIAEAVPNMYVANYTGNTITLADLDGSNSVNLTPAGLSGPVRIALDVTGGKMYVANYSNNTIIRADLDGGNPEDVTPTGLSGPQGIALDVTGGKMYVASETNNTIICADLDGSNSVNVTPAGLSGAIGIDLDVTGGKMYVVAGGAAMRADLDGGNPEDVTPAGLSGAYGIALDLRGPSSAAMVPTLSEWGMIILSLLMAGSAILIIRRKRLVTPNSVH
jgi:DNA-binding beta-propeller fold protein YncE